MCRACTVIYTDLPALSLHGPLPMCRPRLSVRRPGLGGLIARFFPQDLIDRSGGDRLIGRARLGVDAGRDRAAPFALRAQGFQQGRAELAPALGGEEALERGRRPLELGGATVGESVCQRVSLSIMTA